MATESAAPPPSLAYPELSQAKYTCLSEPKLSSELSRLAVPLSVGSTHVVSFQPSERSEDRNQDRFVVQDWILNDSHWRFQAIFDGEVLSTAMSIRMLNIPIGHAGHETADYAVETIPNVVKDRLCRVLASDKAYYDPASVERMLTEAIRDVDDGIAQALYSLFPSSEGLESLSDDAIRNTINDSDTGGKNNITVLRCMRGSTALISLTDVSGANIWVASLGDCQAGVYTYFLYFIYLTASSSC